MKNHQIILLLFFIIGINSSCTLKGKPDNFDYGHVENNSYINDFFHVKIDLPADWVVQTKEQTENLAKTGKELVAGDNKNLKSILDASDVRVVNLLSVFQYELGSPVDYNPSITMVAENVSFLPGIKTGSDYLLSAKKLMEKSQFKYDYLSENFEKEMISGIEFYRMDAQLTYMGIEIKQVYYASIINKFSFNMIISYITEEQKEILIHSVNSLDTTK